MIVQRRLPKGAAVRTDRGIPGVVLHVWGNRRFVRLPNATGWFELRRLRQE